MAHIFKLKDARKTYLRVVDPNLSVHSMNKHELRDAIQKYGEENADELRGAIQNQGQDYQRFIRFIFEKKWRAAKVGISSKTNQQFIKTQRRLAVKTQQVHDLTNECAMLNTAVEQLKAELAREKSLHRTSTTFLNNTKRVLEYRNKTIEELELRLRNIDPQADITTEEDIGSPSESESEPESPVFDYSSTRRTCPDAPQRKVLFRPRARPRPIKLFLNTNDNEKDPVTSGISPLVLTDQPEEQAKEDISRYVPFNSNARTCRMLVKDRKTKKMRRCKRKPKKDNHGFCTHHK